MISLLSNVNVRRKYQLMTYLRRIYTNDVILIMSDGIELFVTHTNMQVFHTCMNIDCRRLCLLCRIFIYCCLTNTENDFYFTINSRYKEDTVIR